MSEAISGFLPKSDIVVLSDYDKGLLTPATLKETIQSCRTAGKPVVVDPKGTSFSKYEDASILTPNLKELGDATRLPVDEDEPRSQS